ncbi:central glycolytic genes regulator [Oceanobacillus picturae]|uniref:Central glycolytic genes regulator n=1 Tax=Oceanobacillus picturae TaxID=171693 RepID=W9ACI1_9BACI|nr:sugar-binding domain-containing protein [Oceanobacillus picturae]GAQ18546.1 central glycolytic genes regulator [Oceanobacillus picturae]CDO03203.1 Central glycolytic genes regulator [Oceanobacillus picturae]
MSDLIDLQKKLVPDLVEVMQQRYAVLHSVDLFQPIGRRSLAENTGMSERNARSEVDFLSKQGLIKITTKGMYISKEGKVILEQLAEFMNEIKGLSVLEKQIKDKLNIEQVIVVPGNSDQYEWVKQEMGKACVSFLQSVVDNEDIIAVTGGTTMAAVANVMNPLDKANNYLFVPARGGIGEKVENQANTIVAEMARKAGVQYRLLYAPDPLSESAYQTIINEPSINETLQHVKGATVVLHGIGDAMTMAKRRKTPEQVAVELYNKQAISEAFGYYFDAMGNVVYKVRTVGIQLEDLQTIDHVVTIAGGSSKGKAIDSYFKQGKSNLLITDEAAAKEILKG